MADDWKTVERKSYKQQNRPEYLQRIHKVDGLAATLLSEDSTELKECGYTFFDVIKSTPLISAKDQKDNYMKSLPRDKYLYYTMQVQDNKYGDLVVFRAPVK